MKNTKPVKAVVYDSLTKQETKECNMQGQLVDCIMLDTGDKKDFTYGWSVDTNPTKENIQKGSQLVQQYEDKERLEILSKDSIGKCAHVVIYDEFSGKAEIDELVRQEQQTMSQHDNRVKQAEALYDFDENDMSMENSEPTYDV